MLRRRLALWTWLLLVVAGAGRAASPPEQEPTPTLDNRGRLVPVDHEWPKLPYRGGEPRLGDDTRPPPPEYAYWYWLKERAARRRGNSDPWAIQGRRSIGGAYPQPGVPLGDWYQQTTRRDLAPERRAPRSVRRLRKGGHGGSGRAASPGARSETFATDPGQRYEVHGPWCSGVPFELCPPDGAPTAGRYTRGPRDGAAEFTGSRPLPPEVEAAMTGRSVVPRKLPSEESACADLAPWETAVSRAQLAAARGKAAAGKSSARSGFDQGASATSKKAPGPEAAADLLKWGNRFANRRPDACTHSCMDCHAGSCQSLKGLFGRYPAYDGGVNRIIGLEERVNLCRTKHQDRSPIRPDSWQMAAVLLYLREGP